MFVNNFKARLTVLAAALALGALLAFSQQAVPVAHAQSATKANVGNVGFGSAVNLPDLGDAGGAELSVQDERRIGAMIMRDYRAAGQVNEDPELTSYLNRLGARVVQAAGESPSVFQFFVVNDSAINAFAMPGGYIGVHTGLIATAQSEDELASVLAHEVAHVTQRHIARRFGQQRQGNAVAAAAVIAAILLASSNPQAATGIAAAGTGFSIDQQLGYSRDAEREADRVGLQALAQAGFQPQAMVDFFGRLQQASRLYENNAPAYLRTHPLTTERIADIRNRVGLAVGTAMVSKPGNTPNSTTSGSKGTPNAAPNAEFELVRMRALLVADTTQQQRLDRLKALPGQVNSQGYKLPVALNYAKAQLYAALGRYPEAQAANQTASASAATVSSPQAQLMLSLQSVRIGLDAALPSSAAAVEAIPPRDKKDLSPSEQTLSQKLSTLITKHPDAWPARLLYADGLQRLGLFQEADAYLKNWAALYPSQPQWFTLQAKSALALGRVAEHHLLLAQAYAARGAYTQAVDQAQVAKGFANGNYYLLSEIDARQREFQRNADEERQAFKRN